MVECITVFLPFSTLREIERDGVLIKNNILKQEGQWTLDRSTESLSGREDVKPQLHCDDSGYDSSRTDGKIGMHQDESGWKKRKSSINTMSHNAPTGCAQLIYESTTTHDSSATIHHG